MAPPDNAFFAHFARNEQKRRTLMMDWWARRLAVVVNSDQRGSLHCRPYSRLLITTQSVSNEHCLSLGHHLAILKLTLERFCRVTTHHRPFNPLSFASCLGLVKVIASKTWARGKGLKRVCLPCMPHASLHTSSICRTYAGGAGAPFPARLPTHLLLGAISSCTWVGEPGLPPFSITCLFSLIR